MRACERALVLQTRLSKTQAMMKLNKALAKTIRLFEQDSHFFLCEPLEMEPPLARVASAPKPPQSPPPAASQQAAMRKAHLLPPTAGPSSLLERCHRDRQAANAVPAAV